MSFRDRIRTAIDWANEERLRRTAGVPRGGGSWCMEVSICKDRALFKGAAVANKGLAGFWFWVCDCPTASEKPACCPIFVGGGQAWAFDWSTAPRLMSQGIYVCASQTADVRTLIATPDAFFEIAYEALR